MIMLATFDPNLQELCVLKEKSDFINHQFWECDAVEEALVAI